jgi:hypothetical protein
MLTLRRSPVGIVISVLLPLAFLAFGANRVIHRATDAINQASSGLSGGVAADAGDSLIRQGNLAGAIAKVRDRGATQVLELRLEPGSARFQVRDGDGAKGYTVTHDGDISDFGVDLIGPGRVQDNVIPMNKLDPATPERIVAGIQAQMPQYSLRDVQFMTLDMDAGSGEFEWSVNIGTPGSGNLFLAKLDGSHVHMPGQP